MAVQLKAPYSLQITEQNQIIAVSSPTCDGNIPFMSDKSVKHTMVPPRPKSVPYDPTGWLGDKFNPVYDPKPYFDKDLGKEVHSYLCWSPARKMPDLVGCYPIESNGKWTEPTVQCIGPDCKQQMCVAYLLS